MMSFRFNIGAATDVGKERGLNEDAFSVGHDTGLFIVADGVGGQNSGEVASHLAVDILTSHLHDQKAPWHGEYCAEFSPATNRVLSGIRLANQAIYQAGQKYPRHCGMATTLSSVYVSGHIMTVAHVGDSRVYRLRDASLQRLTVDHALPVAPGQSGLVTARATAAAVGTPILTRALGAAETVVIDADEVVLRNHDQILLCTDGLPKMVAEEEITRILRSAAADPQKACQQLIEAANAQGSTDNITVILVHCKQAEGKFTLFKKVGLSVPGFFRLFKPGKRASIKPVGR
jgi:protein phosphatase